MTEEYQLDLFGLVLDRVKKHKGYTPEGRVCKTTVIGILKDAEPGANIINFDTHGVGVLQTTKEEFEQEFEFIQSRFYNNAFRLKATSNLDFYCDDGPYLAIDGVLQR